MAISVDLADVKCIISLDTEVADSCWQLMLDDAVSWVTSLGIEDECGEDVANLVARYLAAHFMTLRDPRQVEQSTLDASEKFASTVDLGLDSSHYGQMAKRLDCTGKLSNLDNSDNNGAVKPKHLFCVSGR